jgi:hypothetical protein
MEQKIWVQLTSLKKMETINTTTKTQKYLQIANNFTYHDTKKNSHN